MFSINIESKFWKGLIQALLVLLVLYTYAPFKANAANGILFRGKSVETTTAAKLLNSGDVIRARELALQGMLKNPNDYLAKYLVAKTDELRGDYLKALNTYKELYVNFKDERLELKIIKLLIATGHFREARSYLDRPSINPDVVRKKQLLVFELDYKWQKFAIVQKKVAKYLLETPNDVSAKFLLLRASYYNGDIKTSELLLKRMPDEISKSPDLWIFKSKKAIEQLAFKTGFEYAKYAYSLAPNMLRAKINYIESLIVNQLFSDAKAHIEQLNYNNKEVKAFLNSYLNLAQGKKILARDINLAKKYLSYNERGNLFLALFYNNINKKKQALSYIIRYNELLPNDPLGTNLYAKWSLELNNDYFINNIKYLNKSSIIEEIYNRYFLVYYLQKNDNKMSAVFDKLVSKPHITKLAKEVSPSIARITGVGENFVNIGILYNQYRYNNLLKIVKAAYNGNTRLAFSVIKSELQRNAYDVLSLYAYAKIFEYAQQAEEEIKIHNLIISKDPTFLPSLYKLIKNAKANNNVKRITQLYANAYAKDSHNTKVIFDFASFLFKNNLNEKAIALVEQGLLSDPNNTNLKGLFAKYYEKEGGNNNLFRANKGAKPTNFDKLNNLKSIYENNIFKSEGKYNNKIISYKSPSLTLKQSVNEVKQQKLSEEQKRQYDNSYNDNPLNSDNAFWAAVSAWEDNNSVKAIKRIKVYFQLVDKSDKYYFQANKLKLKINKELGI